MVNVSPCHPTIGKIEMVLKEVFKFSRVFGAFPIDLEYRGISKFDLTRGLIMNLSMTFLAIVLFYDSWQQSSPLSNKITFTAQTILPTLFHFINLAWLSANKSLLREVYEELKDIEYNLWKSGTDWFYKPSWCTKHLSFVLIIIYFFTWQIVHDYFRFFKYHIVFLINVPIIFTILSQYLAMLQICWSLLRDIRLLEESRTVVKLTEKLLSLCQNVNALYEPQLFFFIVNIFLTSLFTIHVNIAYLDDFDKEAYWTILWIILALHPLVEIIMYIGHISEEVKKINKTLYRRLLFNLDDETLQFHLVAKREITFTAAGFFDLGSTLIWSMFTTTVTYLMFFLQYM